MSDMGDMFREMREQKSQFKRERAQAQIPFMEWLQSIASSSAMLPGGIRIWVMTRFNVEDEFQYWPSSGKWCEIKTRKYRQGEDALRRRINELRGLND